LPPCGVDLQFPPNACHGERRGLWGRAAPIKWVRVGPGILVRGSVAKRAVRATFIVFDPPTLQDNAGFAQIAEELAVQAFIAQLVVKAFNIPVLPWTPGLAVKGLDLLSLEPVLHAGWR
jgi:hypothetical protein